MKKLVWNGDRAPENALAGKRIIFLGSSVTYGSASGGVTFADFLAQRHGCEFLAASDYASPSSADREHLDRNGHRILAEAIYNKIKAVSA